MLCIFDFDGTLADSQSAYYQSVKRYAEKNAFPIPSKSAMDLAFGNPQPPYFEGWGPKESFQPHLNAVFSMVDDVLMANPQIMPLYKGVFDFLHGLKDEGFVLSIVTSRNLKPLKIVLKAHNIDSLFTTLRSAQDMIDHGYRGKPHPDKLESVLNELDCQPDKAIMIGDTFMDIQMAKSAGVFALGVTWGYHDRQTLLDYGADAIATSVTQMKDIIEKRLR
jgi:phosphoglycolate phosphatase